MQMLYLPTCYVDLLMLLQVLKFIKAKTLKLF